jgi:BatD DUF11 like domain
MASRLQILLLWMICALGQHSYGQMAFSGNIPASVVNYVIRSNENAADKVKGHLFIQVTADKKTCMVGEPILLTYKLCTQLKSLSTLVKSPSFNGCSVVDMPTEDFAHYGYETINGQLYNVFQLRKVQLYPLQAGNLEIESAVVENTVQFIKENYLLAQDGFQQSPEKIVKYILEGMDKGTAPKDAILTHQVAISSPSISITVKDYPATDKPADFTGATGQFNIAAALSQLKMSTDEVGKLTVALTGKGNMMLLTPPDIQWPEGLEAFEPTVTERVSHATTPISGTKFFEYRFSAVKPGNYTIPAINLSWFDTQKRNYQTSHTPALIVTVTQGNGKQATPVTGPEPEKEKFFNRLFANRWWVAGPVIGLILLGLIVWMRSETKKDKKAKALAVQEKTNAIEEPTPIMEPANPLASAADLLQQNDSHLFYTQLSNDLKKYLTYKMQLPVFNKSTLAVALDKRGVSTETAIELSAILEALEWQLYTPVSDATQMDALYHRSLSVVESIKYETKDR